MPNAIVDNFSSEELKQIVLECNSYKELLIKLGYHSKNGDSYKTIKKRIEKYNIDTSHFQEYHSVKRNEENIFIENSTATQAVLRRWYLKGNYTPYQCSICGLPAEWQNKPLVLTLDHINGINTDDRLENLRWICPNCDRQLPTYSRGAERMNKS